MQQRKSWGFCLVWLMLAIGIIFAPSMGIAQTTTWYDNEYIFPNSQSDVRHRSSQHFRLIWGPGTNADPAYVFDNTPVDDYLIFGNMQMLEDVWHKYHDPEPAGMGFHIPDQPIDLAKRDGKSYRANLILNNTGLWTGGAWGSVDDRQLPMFALPPSYLRWDPPSGATPHEYGHTTLINANGFNNTPYDGAWHEASANWLQLQFENSYPGPGNMILNHQFTLPHGRQYYDAWPIWECLAENPKYGYSFFNTLWTQANGDRARGGEYIFDAMVRLHPAGEVDPYNAIKDVLGNMAARMLNWDFKRRWFFTQSAPPLTTDPFNNYYRRGYSELIRESGSSTVYRIPWEHAPSQGGFSFVPIKLNGKTNAVGGYGVSIDFKPLWDGSRGSDWRACLVAISDNGTTRYSSLWNGGINTITLSKDENKLYLVVCATPNFMGNTIGTNYTVAGLEQQPQAFELAFVNTTAGPYETVNTVPIVDGNPIAGHAHPNGGGFVASKAIVASSAYVGPNAMVLDNAQVSGNARIEDSAVVRGSAQVSENAIISGHALVQENAKIYGNAKVRDWATVGGSWEVYDNGKVLEHADIFDKGTLFGNATEKGAAADYGTAIVTGYAIKDGDCANCADIDHGVLTCWVWGEDQTYADNRPDTGGLYANYRFEKVSPIYAMDQYGITHGYLMGNPAYVDAGNASRSTSLSLNGSNQYVELRKDICDFSDVTYGIWVRWNGGAANQKILSMGDGSNKYMYVTPDDGTGKVKFVISDNGAAAEQTLAGTSAIPANTWTHVALTFSGDTGKMYINGAPVATNTAMTLDPDDLMGPNTVNGGNCNYIGRGNSGGYFSGLVDDFAVYVAPLTDAQVATIGAAATGATVDYYAFDETTGTSAADSIGGKTGTLNGGCSWIAGKTGNGVSLDGTTGYVSLPSGIVQNLTNFTVAAWVKLDTVTVLSKVFDFGTGTNVYMYLTPKHASTNGRLRFAISTSGSGSQQVISGSSAMTAGSWAHVAVTMNGSIGILYLNGVEVGRNSSMTLKPSSLGNTNQNWIGRSQTSSNPYLDGTIDDFRIYNYALSANQISTLGTPDTAAPTPAAAFLIAPVALRDNAITMTAVKGSDASKWVEYYFDCTSGAGHDSGWISANRYTDFGLTPGTYRYTVTMRDRYGNATAASAASTITLALDTTAPAKGAFASAPLGVADGQIAMRAVPGNDPSGVEYYFKCVSSTVGDSGWQASPYYIAVGLSPIKSYSFTVQMRDGKGNVGLASTASTAVVPVDRTPPASLHADGFLWQTLPAGIASNNSIVMRAFQAYDPIFDDPARNMDLEENKRDFPRHVQYYFKCVSGNGPNSGWTDNPYFIPTGLKALETYTYQYTTRDKAATPNTSGWSAPHTVTIPSSGPFVDYSIGDMKKQADGTLVSTTGWVVATFGDCYYIENADKTSGIRVEELYGVIDSTYLGKQVTVTGRLDTIKQSYEILETPSAGERVIKGATITPTGLSAFLPAGPIMTAMF